jgi:hypothetical protein
MTHPAPTIAPASEPIARPSRLRTLLERLAAITFGLLLAWALIEIMLRLAYPTLPDFAQWALRDLRKSPFTESRLLPILIWQQDPTYGVISRPNNHEELYVLSTNGALPVITSNWFDPASQVGFRVPAPDWTPRQPIDALAIGDSFTFCYTAVADCWVTHLAADREWSIINMGMVSTGSISHLRILRDFGVPMQPRLVIWQWYGNDFGDDVWLSTGDAGALVSNSPTAFGCTHDAPLAAWLRDNSGVYTIATSFLCVRNVGFSTSYHLIDGAITMGYGDRYTLQSLDMTDPRNIQGMTLTQDALREARDLLLGQGIDLLLLLIPSKEEVYHKWTVDMLGVEVIDALGEGRRQILAFCGAESLHCFDATDALTEAANQGQQLYWSEDLHLNERGNAVLADALLMFLEP